MVYFFFLEAYNIFMKKYFVLSGSQFDTWKVLVQKALALSDFLELHPLYKDQNYTDFLKKLVPYEMMPANKADGKFYSGRERIRIPLSSIHADLKAQLSDYKFWQNHYLEDPSFWQADNEILAAISHENMVMVERNCFSEILGESELNLSDLS